MPKNIRQVLFPILAAAIWGSAFVFQSMVSDSIGPLTFNGCRSVIAAVFLLILTAIMRKRAKAKGTYRPQPKKKLLLGGLCCGLALTLAANLQQLGIGGTTAGKAGFITAMYIVIVPLLGLFLHKKVRPMVWGSILLACVGLYFLSIHGSFQLSSGDFYVLLCAVVFSVHILLIDYFTQYVDGVALSCAQFAVTALLSLAGSAVFEPTSWANVPASILPILYVGIFSSGIAYTLQILAQKDSNPTVVSLLLSLESVFAALSGALILKETLSGRELMGCGFILAAVVLTQLPQKKLRCRAKSQTVSAGDNS